MHKIHMSSRWGVQIEGSCEDLLKARRFLNGSIRTSASHCVRMYGDVPMLGTTQWDIFQDADTVFQAAVTELSTIRAIIDLIEGCAQLECGTVYDFQDPSNVQMSRKSRIRVASRGAAKPAEEFAIMLARVRGWPKIEPVLNILTAYPSWPEIYRAYEALRSMVGKEKGLKRLFPTEGARIEKLRRTANEFRHFRVEVKMSDPMPYEEAVRYLKDLVMRAICSIDLPPYTGPRALEITLSEYDMPEGGATHLKNLELAQPNHNKIPLELQ